MKKNLGMFVLAPRLGAGAVLLALCAFTPISRADVIIVDNTPPTPTTAGSDSGAYYGQVFTLNNSDGALNVSSLTLSLAGSASGEVYVYNVTGGAPTTQLYDLGSVSSSSSTITVANPALDPLSQGGTYAIVLNATGLIAWNFTGDPANSGDGTLPVNGGQYRSNDGGVIWSQITPGVDFFQMNLTAVPEVPITGAVMGFGALAIAVGGTLRRKLRSAASSIA